MIASPASRSSWTRKRESYTSGEIVVQSSTLTGLEQSLASLEVQLTGSRAELASEHPQVKALERQVAEAEAMITAEEARLVRSKDKPASCTHSSGCSSPDSPPTGRRRTPGSSAWRRRSPARTLQIREMPQLVTDIALQE